MERITERVIGIALIAGGMFPALTAPGSAWALLGYFVVVAGLMLVLGSFQGGSHV